MRLRRPRYRPPVEGLEPVEDSHPKAGLLTEPIVVSRLAPRDPEHLPDGQTVVEFRATVKDADGRRCPDLAVEATIIGPHRSGTGSATTDLMGTVRFKMQGPTGQYTITIDDVAAGALDLDEANSQMTAQFNAPPT